MGSRKQEIQHKGCSKGRFQGTAEQQPREQPVQTRLRWEVHRREIWGREGNGNDVLFNLLER